MRPEKYSLQQIFLFLVFCLRGRGQASGGPCKADPQKLRAPSFPRFFEEKMRKGWDSTNLNPPFCGRLDHRINGRSAWTTARRPSSWPYGTGSMGRNRYPRASLRSCLGYFRVLPAGRTSSRDLPIGRMGGAGFISCGSAMPMDDRDKTGAFRLFRSG